MASKSSTCYVDDNKGMIIVIYELTWGMVQNLNPVTKQLNTQIENFNKKSRKHDQQSQGLKA